ncbi:MarR family transcriptional regulator [Streptomyces sp. SID14478]|uniref:MarR family winged helix-turn-helix transcriptional regulator n=1 Tax=Streptomyces sp. SID14478 TaxID=2706073 RepID=UPI0013DD4D6E|nr:MarR family transcriptional regulator [Streptomyces sp. SID14478]NEB73936.1 MarR family transcriptional regulator [Streptomyces sp. SID14478]
MGKGTVHDPEAVAGGPDTGASSAEDAATGLGSELVRFSRLISASRQRAKFEQGAGERVLLARLVRDGAQRATDLAAATLLDLSTVSRQVRSMVERGLIERHPDPEDGRGTLLHPTEDGIAAFEAYRRQRDAELTQLLQPWSPEDRYQLIRLMARLNDDLAQHQITRHDPGNHSGSVAQQGASKHD